MVQGTTLAILSTVQNIADEVGSNRINLKTGSLYQA